MPGGQSIQSIWYDVTIMYAPMWCSRVLGQPLVCGGAPWLQLGKGVYGSEIVICHDS